MPAIVGSAPSWTLGTRPFRCPLQPAAAGVCHLYEAVLLPDVHVDNRPTELFVSCRHLAMAENTHQGTKLRCAIGDAKVRRDYLA